jgi:hypothetical protein
MASTALRNVTLRTLGLENLRALGWIAGGCIGKGSHQW